MDVTTLRISNNSSTRDSGLTVAGRTAALDPVTLDHSRGAPAGRGAALSISALAAISSNRLTPSAITSDCIATEGVATERVAAGVATGSGCAHAARARSSERVTTGRGGVAAARAAAGATIATSSPSGRIDTASRRIATLAALGAGIRVTVLAYT